MTKKILWSIFALGPGLRYLFGNSFIGGCKRHAIETFTGFTSVVGRFSLENSPVPYGKSPHRSDCAFCTQLELFEKVRTTLFFAVTFCGGFFIWYTHGNEKTTYTKQKEQGICRSIWRDWRISRHGSCYLPIWLYDGNHLHRNFPRTYRILPRTVYCSCST